jgi:hypothetical protein
MALYAPGRWVSDLRGERRGARVSAHVEAGFLVLSTWKSGECVGTVRLLPDEAASLIAGLAEGLALLADESAAATALDHGSIVPPSS